MGLDLYVRWTNITEDEKNAQYTGYVDAPEAGYLRYSWGGLDLVRSFCKERSLPVPVPMYAEWDGSNSDDMPVTEELLGKLLVQRTALQQALDTFPFGEYDYHDDPNQRGLGSFIKRKFEACIGIINFVEQHKDEEGITLCFA